LVTICIAFSCRENKSLTQEYHISGEISNYPENEMVYLNREGSVDSTLIQNSNFTFQGRIEQPEVAHLSFKTSRQRKFFWLENTNFKITGSLEEFKNAHVEGGMQQKMANLLGQQKKVIIDKKIALNALIQEGRDSLLNKDSLLRINKSLTTSLIEIERDFLQKNPNSMEAGLILNKYKRNWAKDTIRNIFGSLTPSVQKSKNGLAVKRFLEFPSCPKLGEKYIDFESKTIKGEKVNISELLGEYTLVDFWASWCRPCREENPSLVTLYDKYNKEGFNIIGVSRDSDKQRWLSAIKKDGLKWDHINDFDYDSEAVLIYEITEIPDNFLIDKEGKIIARNLRGNALKDKIESLFEKKD